MDEVTQQNSALVEENAASAKSAGAAVARHGRAGELLRVEDAKSAASSKRQAAAPPPKVVASNPQTRAVPKQAVAAARRPAAVRRRHSPPRRSRTKLEGVLRCRRNIAQRGGDRFR